MLESIILGLVQGLGEFLPISSSAHLVLVPWFFQWEDPGLTFDIALHVGTLFAVVFYFWRDWWRLIVQGLTNPKGTEGRLFWYLAIASVPAAVGGFLLEKTAETIFRNPLLIAGMLSFLGLALYWADQKSIKKIEFQNISLSSAILIGVFQTLAIIPGVSRSGITMTTGLFLGLTREASTKFSFLLSTPIIFGAALVKLPHIVSNPSAITPEFLIGMLVSALFGFAGIGFLMRYVRTKTFLPFVWYRFALSAAVVAVLLAR